MVGRRMKGQINALTAIIVALAIIVVFAFGLPVLTAAFIDWEEDSAVDFLQNLNYWVLGAGEQVPGHLIPSQNNTYDLGSDSNRWRNVYAPTGRSATFVVAASDASSTWIAQADYFCDNVSDEEQIQAAVNAGGIVMLSPGAFSGGSLDIIDGTIVKAAGRHTIYNLADGASIVIKAGGALYDIEVDVGATYTSDAVVVEGGHAWTKNSMPLSNVFIYNTTIAHQGTGLLLKSTVSAIGFLDFGPIMIYGFEYGVKCYQEASGYGYINGNTFRSLHLYWCKYYIDMSTDIQPGLQAVDNIFQSVQIEAGAASEVGIRFAYRNKVVYAKIWDWLDGYGNDAVVLDSTCWGAYINVDVAKLQYIVDNHGGNVIVTGYDHPGYRVSLSPGVAPARMLESTVEDLTFYVDQAGSNSNDGSVGSPFQTITFALDAVPKIIRHNVVININDGTWNEIVKIQGFVTLPWTYDYSSAASLAVVSTSGNATLCLVDYVRVNGCHGNIRVCGLSATTTSGTAFEVMGSGPDVYFYGVNVTASAPSHDGFSFTWGSSGRILNSTVSNRNRGVVVRYGSTVHCGPWASGAAGSGNQVGLRAETGAVIRKYDNTQPTGTVNEQVTFGGYISVPETTFTVNSFQYPAPSTEWVPVVHGAYLGSNQTTVKVWIPLSFLKTGDQILSYKLLGDAIETTALTLDCKLVRVSKTDPLTLYDVNGGAIAQVNTDGNFDVTGNPDDLYATTDWQFVLEIVGTTGTSDEIYVMGAEVLARRQ